MMKYRDQCDLCNKFAYCKGFNGQALCEECIKQLSLNTSSKMIGEIMNGIERIKTLASQVTDKCVIKIVDYLITREDMNDKYLNEEKNLKQMLEYIKSRAKEHKENNVAIIDDEQVYNWAIHYFDETNEALKIDLSTSSVDNKENKIQSKNNSKTKNSYNKSNWRPEGQLTLF